jgi:hypothetical protein
MADDIRLRAACDRCHSHKLRCPKKAGESTCNRCSKARATCTFSPFRQKKQIFTDNERDATINSATQLVSTHDNLEVVEDDRENKAKRKRTLESSLASGIDSTETVDLSTSNTFGIVNSTTDNVLLPWVSDTDVTSSQVVSTGYSAADPNFDDEISEYFNIDQSILELPSWNPSKELMPPYRIQPSTSLMLRDIEPLALQTDTNNWFVSPLSGYLDMPDSYELTAQSKPTQAPASLVRQLSELSIELYECSLKVPPLSMYGTPLTVEEMNKYSRFSLEEAVILTQKTINLYPIFLIALFGLRSKSTDNSSNMAHTRISELSTNDSLADDFFATPGTASDYSAIHLMLSCHLRLISIWELMLQHMDSSLKQAHGCFHGAYQPAQCGAPTFKMGAYVPPARMAINMHLLVFSTHFKQLYDYADELSVRLESLDNATPPPNSHPGANSMSQKAVADVKERASGISTNLKTLVGVLLESGMIDQLI